MAFKLVVFDFDGTLAASLPWLLGVFDEVAERFGFRKLDRNEVDGLRNFNVHQLLSHYGVSPWKLPFIARHVRSLMQRDIAVIKPVPGIEAALGSLVARGIELAILTSNSSENVRDVLGRETTALFRYWECGSSIFGKAPKLRRLLQTSGCTSDQVIFIGDEIRDAVAAQDARIPFGAVAWGFTHLRALLDHSVAETFLDTRELVVKLT